MIKKSHKSKKTKGSVNPFAQKANSKKKAAGKRIGKSKKLKANNQLNKIIK